MTATKKTEERRYSRSVWLRSICSCTHISLCFNQIMVAMNWILSSQWLWKRGHWIWLGAAEFGDIFSAGSSLQATPFTWCIGIRSVAYIKILNSAASKHLCEVVLTTGLDSTCLDEPVPIYYIACFTCACRRMHTKVAVRSLDCSKATNLSCIGSPLFRTPGWLVKDCIDRLWNMAGYGLELQNFYRFFNPQCTASDPQAGSLLLLRWGWQPKGNCFVFSSLMSPQATTSPTTSNNYTSRCMQSE